MGRKWLTGVVLFLALATSAVFVFVRNDGFSKYAFPLKESDRLFDLGVVDANGDGRLDVYTSNHHFRQALLVADGTGGYRDVLSEWGLDQSREFPLAELSFAAPPLDRPGVYVYWLGTNLIVQAHRIGEAGKLRGSFEVSDPVKVVKQDGFAVSKQEERTGSVTRTRLAFSADADGTLVTTPGGQGLPIEFDLADALRPDAIFVGRGAVSPQATRFALAMQDRHGHAWADFNGDGVTDVFITRGGLGGTIRAYPPEVAAKVKDELFISRAPGKFQEAGTELGVSKKGCSGRHAKWVDFDGDGFLDLFVNCYDRERVSGEFPKQLYRQDRGSLRDVAEEVGIGLPHEQMGNVAWLDVDGDGDEDLLAFQDAGPVVYRNQSGTFIRESVATKAVARSERIGVTEERSWLYEGKLTVSDYDADGDLDVFASSRRGNVLLKNTSGRFAAVDLAAAGLPENSLSANWVDYDNDGLIDLHLVPQGLYRQRGDHRFTETGLLAFHPDQYQAAIVNWADLDNDGRIDALVALEEQPSFRHWWEFSAKPRRAGLWKVEAYRNVGAAQHWLQLRLIGQAGNRDAIGAMVRVATPSGEQAQEVGSAEGSFFSQGHYRLYFGLGPHAAVERLRIEWPDGSQQELRDVPANRLVTVEQKGA